MEKHLFPELKKIKQPLQLRARYIERLLMPCYDTICALRHIRPDISRKRNHDDDDDDDDDKYIGSSIKKPRIPIFDISLSEEMDQTHEHKLGKLGSAWIEFYDNQKALKKISHDEIYHILVLVSSIGSPQVLIDLHRVLRPRLNAPPDLEESTLGKLYRTYMNHETVAISCSTNKRLISICMYNHYSNFLSDRESKSQPKSSDKLKYHNRGHAMDAKKPSTLAYDDMIAAIMSLSYEEVKQDRESIEKHKPLRLKLRKICMSGKKVVDFDKKIRMELGIHRLSDLLPTRSMPSPLGEMVKPDEYVFGLYRKCLNILTKQRIPLLGQEKEKFEIFIDAIKNLRSRLGTLCTLANQYEWNSSPLKMRLAHMDYDTIMALEKEPLDSDLLLSCFDAR